MQSASRHLAGLSLASFGWLASAAVFPAAFAQQAPSVATRPSVTGTAASCFTATVPADIVSGCSTFLDTGQRNTNADRTGLALQRRGGARARLGDLDLAISDFQRMARTGYKPHEAHASIASVQFRRRRFAEAETSYREALRINPSYALAQLGLGQTLVALGRPAEAMAHFDRALATDVNDARAHLGKGTALAATGDTDGALRSFDAALTINPRFLAALYQRAQTHIDKGDRARALADADTAVSISSGEAHVRALVYRGRLRNNARNSAGAIADCTAAHAEASRLAIADADLRASAQVCLGLAHQSAGQLAEAKGSYDRALALSPNDVSALSGRGYVLVQRGRYDDAIADFQAALRISPRAQDALRFMGLAYADKGDAAGAKRAFERAIAADAKDPWPLMIRAISEARNGDRQRALADVESALAITGPDASDALLVRGAVRYYLGDFDLARTDLESALRLDPQNGQAYTNLARLEIRTGHLDAARKAQETAARLLPNDASVFLQQGLIELAHKDYARAVTELTRSLDINDAHAEGFAALGQAHEALGQTTMAIADYRKAATKLALDPDARAAQALARQRLAALTSAPAAASTGSQAPPSDPSAPAETSVYCRLAEGVFTPSRKYTGVDFDVGCHR